MNKKYFFCSNEQNIIFFAIRSLLSEQVTIIVIFIHVQYVSLWRFSQLSVIGYVDYISGVLL